MAAQSENFLADTPIKEAQAVALYLSIILWGTS
jgi:hypothetical protein